jgi:hypothetical protein
MLFVLVFVHGHGFGSFSLGVRCVDWGSVFVDFGYVLAFSKLLKVICFCTTVFVLHPGGVCDFAIVSGSGH